MKRRLMMGLLTPGRMFRSAGEPRTPGVHRGRTGHRAHLDRYAPAGSSGHLWLRPAHEPVPGRGRRGRHRLRAGLVVVAVDPARARDHVHRPAPRPPRCDRGVADDQPGCGAPARGARGAGLPARGLRHHALRGRALRIRPRIRPLRGAHPVGLLPRDRARCRFGRAPACSTGPRPCPTALARLRLRPPLRRALPVRSAGAVQLALQPGRPPRRTRVRELLPLPAQSAQRSRRLDQQVGQYDEEIAFVDACCAICARPGPRAARTPCSWWFPTTARSSASGAAGATDTR